MNDDTVSNLTQTEFHNIVKLKTLLFEDNFGQRYLGEILSGDDAGKTVKVTVFNKDFSPSMDKTIHVEKSKSLLGSPLPLALSEIIELNTELKPAYIIEDEPKGVPLGVLLEQKKLDWKSAVRIACQLTRVLEWMNTTNVTHHALHLNAIYVDEKNHHQIQVSEWAHGHLAFHKNAITASKRGDFVAYPAYMVPEVIADAESADIKSALYSVGLIISDLFAGNPP